MTLIFLGVLLAYVVFASNREERQRDMMIHQLDEIRAQLVQLRRQLNGRPGS